MNSSTVETHIDFQPLLDRYKQPFSLEFIHPMNKRQYRYENKGRNNSVLLRKV